MDKNKIFISHRHSDTQSDCHRLKSDLQEHFGKENVFLDIENLEPGINFSEAIEKYLALSKVVLVVIGPDWYGPEDDQGVKRVFKSNDWVRREVVAALKSEGTRVIPVLMKKASEPQESHLPDDLKPLAGLQATEITIKRWDYDVGELIKVIERIVPKVKKPQVDLGNRPQPRHHTSVAPPPKSWWAKNYLWVLGGLVAFFALIGLMNRPEDPTYEDQNTAQTEEQSDPPSSDRVGTISSEGDPRITNPEGNEIYNSLTFKKTAPNFAGKWWLYENGIRSGYFEINQSNDQFSFTYFLFDTPVGSGTGYFKDNYLISELFTLKDAQGDYGFKFQTPDDGKSWIGETYSNQVISQSYLVKTNP